MSKVFILDTNVLLHDSKSILAFKDNEVVIPLVVLDELDKIKSGQDEKARNARMVIRTLDSMRGQGNLSHGVATPDGGTIRVELNHKDHAPADLDKSRADNRIISVALGLMKDYGTDKKVAVVSKDINLRVKCDALGVQAEDYDTDAVADDASMLYSGWAEVSTDSADIDDLYKNGYIEIGELGNFYTNQYVLLRSNTESKHSCLAKVKHGVLHKLSPRPDVWGISPRNKEQVFALDALFDPDIKLVTLVGKAGCGKAQPLDSKILTPYGWKPMGEIKSGDVVSTPDGKHATVLSIYPQGKKDIYRVTFTDGSSTKCCKEHLWYTQTSIDRNAKRSGSVKSLDDISNTLRYGKYQKRNHSIPITKPIEFNKNEELPIDSYLLGLLIGDGSLNSTTPSIKSKDEFIINYIENEINKYNLNLKKRKSGIDFYISKKYIGGKRRPSSIKNYISEEIKNLNLNVTSENKFIPNIYKFASINDRINILNGLLDTDGSISKNGHIEYTTVSKSLSDDISFIVRSLGGTTTIKTRMTKYKYKNEVKNGKLSYRVNIILPNEIKPFKLQRKLDRVIERIKYFPRRYIDKIEYVGKEEAQCIYIDSPDHLYITDDFIVTHNTLLAAAAGIEQLLDSHIYKKLILSRPIQPMGRDLGFLPGDIDEKMAPWMAPLNDNLELLFSEKGKNYLEMHRDSGAIEVEALTYIRGRSIPKSYIIVDEAQNLTLHELKTIITRVGDGSKVILTGDINQIDNPYIDALDNGLSCVLEKFKGTNIAAHITLSKGERSELATLASEIL